MNVVGRASSSRMLIGILLAVLIPMGAASPVSASPAPTGPWPTSVYAVGGALCSPFGAKRVRITYLDQHPESPVILATYGVTLKNFPDGPVTASAHVFCQGLIGAKEYDKSVTVTRTLPGFASISGLSDLS